MDPTSLVGKAKELEVASALTKHGLLVFIPLVDMGADLVVSTLSMMAFKAIQVKYRAEESGLTLDGEFVDRWATANPLIAFVIEGRNEGTWYVPLDEYRKLMKKKPRGDNKVYITISESRSALEPFEDERGIAALKQWFTFQEGRAPASS